MYMPCRLLWRKSPSTVVRAGIPIRILLPRMLQKHKNLRRCMTNALSMRKCSPSRFCWGGDCIPEANSSGAYQLCIGVCAHQVEVIGCIWRVSHTYSCDQGPCKPESICFYAVYAGDHRCKDAPSREGSTCRPNLHATLHNYPINQDSSSIPAVRPPFLGQSVGPPPAHPPISSAPPPLFSEWWLE